MKLLLGALCDYQREHIRDACGLSVVVMEKIKQCL